MTDMQNQNKSKPTDTTMQYDSSENLSQTILPTKNIHSLISYYCGIFGLIPFIGLPLSIAAVITGKIALGKYKVNPTPGAKGHAMVGLILGIVELVIFAIFITLFIIANVTNQ